MNNPIKKYPALLLILFISASCHNNPVNTESAGAITKEIKLKYEKICTPPNYGGQTMMISNYDNFIIVAGSVYIQKYDTLAKTWQVRTINSDPNAARWDGAFCRLGNSMYLFGPAWNFSNLSWYKVVKMDPVTLNSWMTDEPLPFTSYIPYPAHTVSGNKMVAVYSGLDSIYCFDGTTEKGHFVAKNPEKSIYDSWGLIYYSGQYKNFFYLFNPITLKFYKINLSDYSIEPVRISNEILNILNSSETDYSICGGVTENLLVIIKNNKIYCCNLDTYEWFNANIDLPLTDWWVESTFQTADAFYFQAWLSGTIWKVSKAK